MKRNTAVIVLIGVMVVFTGCTGIGANDAEEEFNEDPDKIEETTEIQDETENKGTKSENTSSSSNITDENGKYSNNSKVTDAEINNEEQTTKIDPSPEKSHSSEKNDDGKALEMADEIYTLTVYVVEPIGVADVSIALTQPGDQTITTQKTNEDGVIKFGVADGDYTISGTGPNGKIATATVTIDGEDSVILLE